MEDHPMLARKERILALLTGERLHVPRPLVGGAVVRVAADVSEAALGGVIFEGKLRRDSASLVTRTRASLSCFSVTG
jgi:hypothetical protein